MIILRLATYARAIDPCPDHWPFIFGIAFNHVNMYARFSVFHSPQDLHEGGDGREETLGSQTNDPWHAKLEASHDPAH